MEIEDETPVIETRDFDSEIEPMMTSMRTATPTRSCSDDNSTEDDDTGSADNGSTQSSPHSVDKAAMTTKSLAIENHRKQFEADKMSESYHEIFDSQMPPEAAAQLYENSEAEDALEMEKEDRLASLCSDTEAATRYLTSKLVEDSIRWQLEQSSRASAWPPSGSPFGSPIRKRPQNLMLDPLSDSVRDGLQLVDRQEMLDPTAILEIERHARYLATSVDSMIENLAGILQSISALTVDTLETYRDGVCKTCDEVIIWPNNNSSTKHTLANFRVDGNIKSMYQLMAKVEELNKSMAPAYKLAEQVKEVKRLLEMLENVSNAK